MHRFLLFGYSIFYSAAFLLYLPVMAWKRLSSGKRSPVLARLGRAPGSPAECPVWVHAVSVGEVNAVRPLIDSLLSDHRPVVVSTTTVTGRQVAMRHFPEVAVFHFPFDWRWSCRRALKAVRPKAVLLAETELWPGFLAEAARQSVPVALVNARLSDASLRGYRFFPSLLRPLLGGLAAACAQSATDSQRLAELGVPPNRITITGNLKYDVPPPRDASSALRSLLRGALGIPDNPVWLWGSTREGEEEQLLHAHLAARARWPGLKLIAAPRHPHRAGDVCRILEAASLRVVRRSRINGAAAGEPDALVLDTVGELAAIFPIANLVFVGGSLVNRGGQNPLEAAVVGRAIVVGPYMHNFRDITATLLEADALRQVPDVAGLEQVVLELLADDEERERLGEQARRTVEANRGALQRCRRALLSLPGLNEESAC